MKYILAFLSLCFMVTQSAVAQTKAEYSDSIKTTNLQEIVITGQYTPQLLSKSVYNVRVINQDRIKKRAANNVLSVLSNELGVRLSTDYTLGETDFQLMGVSGARVKILLDGVPLVDRDATRQSLAQIDINNIERIEMVDGPMSVMYGTDALGGVINIITKKPKGSEGLSVNARIQEESMGSKYSAFSKAGIHNEYLGVNWSKGKLYFLAYGTRNNMGGWNDTAAYPAQVSKPKDQWLAGSTIGWRNNKLNAWYRLDYVNESLFDAGVMNINNYRGIDKYYITNRLNHQAQLDWKLSDQFKLNTAISFQDYKRATETYLMDYRTGSKSEVDPTTAGQEGAWDISKFRNFFVRSTATWFVSPKLTIQPGIEIKTDNTSGQRIAADATSITDYSVFASAEYTPTSWLSVRPGLRFSHNSIYDAPPAIPSVNAKVAFTKNLDMRVSYARGFRAPMLRELYFYYFDANHAIEGNPDLKAEYSNSYHAAFTWQSRIGKSAFSSTLSGFYNDYNNFIGMAFREGTQIYTYLNLDKFKTLGTTLENSFSVQQLTATLGFSYVGRYNQYQEVQKDLPDYVWSPEVNSNITYKFKKLKAELGLFYKYTGKTPNYATNASGDIYLAEVNSFHWADLTASKQLFKFFTLQAGVKNIFNVGRVNSTAQGDGAHSTGGARLTGYGRTFFAGVLVNWHQ